MRYLLLSVLVVCMIGIMIPVNFANAWHVCDNPDDVTFEKWMIALKKEFD